MRKVMFSVVAALILGAGPALAQGGVQPLDRILSHMRNERPGTFYDADGPFSDSAGSVHYRIKWLTPEGRLIWLDTDARTGRVLGTEHGRADRFPGGGERRGMDNGPDRFDNPQGPGYNRFPRDNFPRWQHWQNGGPGGGHWRGGGGGRHGG